MTHKRRRAVESESTEELLEQLDRAISQARRVAAMVQRGLRGYGARSAALRVYERPGEPKRGGA